MPQILDEVITVESYLWHLKELKEVFVLWPHLLITGT